VVNLSIANRSAVCDDSCCGDIELCRLELLVLILLLLIFGSCVVRSFWLADITTFDELVLPIFAS
jgi:hypothetical protein